MEKKEKKKKKWNFGNVGGSEGRSCELQQTWPRCDRLSDPALN